MLVTPAGTTLVETLVALLLVAFLAAALATSTRAALHAETGATRRERAGELAAEGLERLLAEPPETLTARIEVETLTIAGEALARERRVEPGPAPGLWRLTVTVRALRGGAPVSVATLRRAAWSVP